MGLRDLTFKAVYRTDTDNLLEDFYIPTLSKAVRYDRAVGFFSAGVMAAAAQGVSALIENNGHMRLIVGAELDAATESAILLGHELRESGTALESHLLGILASVRDQLIHRRFELLAYLVASGRLEVKVALRRRGMYHEKIGVVYDSDGDFVVFQGSMNETPTAMIPSLNFESINVFEGWRPELSAHCTPHVDAFEKLWDNRARATSVVPLPVAVRDEWYRTAPLLDELMTAEGEIGLAKRHDPSDDLETMLSEPAVPREWQGRPFRIRPHQRAALEAWQRVGWQALFAMATGAGKTVTAIYGAVKVFKRYRRLAVVVAVPYQALADQWVKELNRFGIYPHRCYESKAQWAAGLTTAVRHFVEGGSPFLCAVVVNRSLRSEEFQSAIRQLPKGYFLFIGDECHHHGSVAFGGLLPANTKFRMGLSATPKHYCDLDANRRLEAFYGTCSDRALRFSLKDALDSDTLTPYEYSVVAVALTDDEMEEYAELTRRIGRALSSTGKDGEVSAGAGALMGQRTRLLGLAANKVPTLIDLLRGQDPEPMTLFYVGEGSVDDETGGQVRMVEQASAELDAMGWNVARFTSQEGRGQRTEILDRFRAGLLDGLVAMRCLDEGIDLPACSSAYIMSSSRNPRQFIQRRGRVLRRAAGKKMARIWDFVVVPPSDSREDFTIRRKLLEAELKRVWEFASLSRNPESALTQLRNVVDEYELNHVLTGGEGVEGEL